jgi:hypothetical protein
MTAIVNSAKRENRVGEPVFQILMCGLVLCKPNSGVSRSSDRVILEICRLEKMREAIIIAVAFIRKFLCSMSNPPKRYKLLQDMINSAVMACMFFKGCLNHAVMACIFFKHSIKRPVKAVLFFKDLIHSAVKAPMFSQGSFKRTVDLFLEFNDTKRRAPNAVLFLYQVINFSRNSAGNFPDRLTISNNSPFNLIIISN